MKAGDPVSSGDILNRPPPAADARLSYGIDALQFADLRLPAGGSSHSVVIVIHGGFWKAAHNLDHAGHLSAALAADGVATWCLEYRRVGNRGGGWPSTADDVLRGADHLWRIGDQYGLDLKRVVVLGHSAGGQLALYLAAEQAVQLRGVVSLAGIVDLRRAWELGVGGNAVAGFLGGSPEQVPAIYRQASPIERLPIPVSQRLIHGTDDDVVPIEICERYAQAARTAGNNVTLTSLDGTGHFELIDPRSPQWPVVRREVLSLLN